MLMRTVFFTRRQLRKRLVREIIDSLLAQGFAVRVVHKRPRR